MSQLVIRESSNLEETSQDEELSDWQRDNMAYAKQMASSIDKVDERFINLYRIKRAHQMGLNIGLKDVNISRRNCKLRHPTQSKKLQKPKNFVEDSDLSLSYQFANNHNIKQDDDNTQRAELLINTGSAEAINDMATHGQKR